MSGTLWLVRHAESVWNADGRWQGQGDPPLSPRGHRQVEQLAGTLGPAAIDLVVASDLRRAVQTAQGLVRAWGAEVRWDERLRERALGAWTGLWSAQIVERWARDLERLRAGDEALRPGGGETIGEVRDRLGRALADLSSLADRRIVVVTHGGVLDLLRPGVEAENAEGWETSSAACLRELEGSASRAGASRSGSEGRHVLRAPRPR